jgi:DNA-binding transcriptional LysR family regulator
MELRHLRYFLAVAETQNFRRAAEREFVAQSALSQQIARLEAQLGTRLFTRTTRHVRLTPAGEVLRPLARRILADVEHAESEMVALTGLQRGRLSVGMIQAGSAIDLIALIHTYYGRHPGIELSVRIGASSDMVAAVRTGELDIAIIALPASDLPASLEHHALVDDPLVAVLSREAAQGVEGEISLPELVKRGAFIHYMPRSGLRHSVTAALDRVGLIVEPAFELAQITDMIRLAALGVGVTVVPKAAIEQLAGETGHATDFVVLALTDPEAVHCIGVVHESGRLTPAAKAFRNMLLEVDPDHVVRSMS